jgi:acetoin utilization protein AcuB
MTIRACMTTNPVTLRPETRLSEALDLMKRHGLRNLPVIETDRRFVGVVRQHDVQEEVRKDATAAERGVLGIAILGTPTLNGNESMEKAWAELSRSPGSNPLPVVESGCLAGTVSQHELLRAMAGLSPHDESVTLTMPPGITAKMLNDWTSGRERA